MEQDRKDLVAGFLLGLAGTIAGIFLTPVVRTNATVLNLNWSLVLPLTAALAYGTKSALAAYLAGLFLLPFVLWPGDGVLNFANTIFLGLWLVLSARIQKDFRQGRLRLPLLHQTTLNLAYALVFFTAKVLLDLVSGIDVEWNSSIMISLKGFLVRLLLILSTSALLELNGIRRVLGLAATRDRANHIPLGLGGLGCWLGSVGIFWWLNLLAGRITAFPLTWALHGEPFPFELVFFALISGIFVLGGLNGLFRINSLLRVRMVHLQAQTAALRRIHRALSEDLKEPMIAATGFARLAVKDLEKGNLTQVAHDLAKINATLESAATLTSSLILLGEVDTSGKTIDELNSLKPLIRSHFERLQKTYSVWDAQLKLGEDWVRVGVSLSALDALVAAILENAFLFRSADRPLLLEAGMACKEEGNPRFFFRDNGRGLRTTEARRLNNPEEWAGTGLTLARRLTELAGGELLLESDGLDRGTTVWVSFSAMELCDRLG